MSTSFRLGGLTPTCTVMLHKWRKSFFCFFPKRHLWSADLQGDPLENTCSSNESHTACAALVSTDRDVAGQPEDQHLLL